MMRVICRGVKTAFGKIKLKAGPEGVSRRNILALSARALIEGISSTAIVNGFAATGIWPLSPERLLRSQQLDLNKVAGELESAAADLENKAQHGASKQLDTDINTFLGIAGNVVFASRCFC
jgi:hypothetical protein